MNKGINLVFLAIMINIGLVTSEENWTWYNGTDMRFEYPAEWGIIGSSTGVVLGDNQTFALSITMHEEGCYPMAYHPLLMDYMLKLWSNQMFGNPSVDPITQFIETDTGPYSIGQQLFSDPFQILICEIQGYTAKNVTVTYATAIWEPLNPVWSEENINIGKVKKSLNITVDQPNPLI